MESQKHTYIAIDVAKDSLQVQMPGQNHKIAYEQKLLKKLLKRIQNYENPLVVCEATGGYERPLIAELVANGIAYALVNPRRLRAFAASEGTKAKTDPIDAKLLLRFAEEKKLQANPPTDKERQELAGLLDRRAQLSEQLAREKNRLNKAPASIRPLIEEMIEVVEKQIKQIDTEIGQKIKKNEILKKEAKILQSVTGIGPITTWTLIAYLPEIHTLERNQLVALAGLAPYNKDSGKKKGKRSISAGRAKIRRSLYMAAVTASTHNPVIYDFVERLKDKGKPDKVAKVAAMRKLLIYAQSLVRKSKKEEFALA